MSRLSRLSLLTIGVIGILTGLALLRAPDRTADYFVWTVNPPATALFMGAGYLASGLVLVAVFGWVRTWEEARLLLPSIAVFGLMMLGATMLHADRFFWDRPQTLAWVGLYVLIVAAAIGLPVQERRRRPAWAWGQQLAAPVRLGLGVAGLVMAGWSLLLFGAPELARVLWPWPLTALTSRIIGGWVAVGATLALVTAASATHFSVRLPLVSWMLAVAGFLMAGGVGLWPVEAQPAAGIYFGGLFASGAGAWWLLRRALG